MVVTLPQLRAIMPNLPAPRAALFLDPIAETAERFALDSPQIMAAFLAQLAQESGELRRLEENLNYGAAGLLATFPSRFGHHRGATLAEKLAGNALAEKLARKPEAIANHVYANRFGNGPESSGDGWRYRGRGAIQVTFRESYQRCGNALGIDLAGNPDHLAEPRVAILSAGWYWDDRKINVPAAAGDFREVTRRINPALKHLAEREIYFRRALGVLEG